MQIRDYKIASISAQQERQFIFRWHYAKKSVPNSAIRLGCFHKGELIGVAAFGRIINCKPIFKTTSMRAGLELNRLAMCDEAPKNSESWFLMRCIKLMRKQYPWLLFIHTWADGLRCQGGTIYKACGFHYLRKIALDDQYQLPDGSVMHRLAFRTYNQKYKSRLKDVHGNIEKVRAIFGADSKMLAGYNYHYVYLVDSTLKADLILSPQPYEKVEKVVP